MATMELPVWLEMILATLGRKGRTVFGERLRALLELPDTPKTLSVAWNEQVALTLETTAGA